MICEILKKNNINNIIIATSNNYSILDNLKKIFNCINVLDVRSAIYYATGIAAQNYEKVIVFSDSDNSSRSAFSGMTEAFYRNLPIIFVTLGSKLNYTKELNDVVQSHFVCDTLNDLNKKMSLAKLPCHIELINEKYDNYTFDKCYNLQKILLNILNEDYYLYISKNIELINESYRCKLVNGGMVNCFDGAISNILGASLNKSKKKYIGIITEKEYIHDINALGNTNINDSLILFVLITEKKYLLDNVSKNLAFEINIINQNEINENYLNTIINSSKKTICFINNGELK